MSDAKPQLSDLEGALLQRARTLADEYLAHARRTRDQVIADANERLRLREEREILAAKALAERTYRQRVQANEIRQQEELDRTRWTLVRQVMDALPARLDRIAEDEKRYLPLLARYLAHGAQVIERDALVAELNGRDHARLAKRWDAFCREAGVQKSIVFATEPLAASKGGVRVRSADGKIGVDNTFEGRLERMQDDLHRVVTERLFASTETLAALSGS